MKNLQAELEKQWEINKAQAENKYKPSASNILSSWFGISKGSSTTGPKKNDFIQRPGQAATSFSSRDTIIGVKDPSKLGGGATIVITGDNYGTNPDKIAEGIMRQLRRKIAV
jgi:hypothetical protein